MKMDGPDARKRRSYLGLLVALGLDNFGSGLFLPLTLVYATRVIGLPLASAGTALTVGTVFGLIVPAITGRVVDRIGPRAVVIVSQLIQFAGLLVYFWSGSFYAAVIAAVLVASGTQMFYSALVALIADAAPEGPKDRPLALVFMTRAGAFGAGALAAGLALAQAGNLGLRAAVLVDALTFVVAAALLALLVSPSSRAGARGEGDVASVAVLRNRHFLALILVNTLVALAGDFFLVGFSVFALEILGAPDWTTGVCFALLTGMTTIGGTTAVRLTARFLRTTTMAVGAGLILLCCLGCIGLMRLPREHVTVWLILLAFVFSLGSLLCESRSSAMAEATAPADMKGRYLAAFQYSYAAASLVAPLLVSLFVVDARAPWLVLSAALATSILLLRWLSTRLPRSAVHVLPPAPLSTQASELQRS